MEKVIYIDIHNIEFKLLLIIFFIYNVVDYSYYWVRSLSKLKKSYRSLWGTYHMSKFTREHFFNIGERDSRENLLDLNNEYISTEISLRFHNIARDGIKKNDSWWSIHDREYIKAKENTSLLLNARNEPRIYGYI